MVNSFLSLWPFLSYSFVTLYFVYFVGVLFAAVSPGIIAFTLYTMAQKKLGASITGFTLYIFTIYAAIYGFIFFDEKLIEKRVLVNKWHAKTEYVPKRIENQKRIANTLYEHKKYYLD